MTTYTFKAFVTLDDVSALLAAATANYIKNAIGTSTDPDVADAALLDARGLLEPDGEIDIAACIQELLDPGVSPSGISIDESTCEADDYEDSEETYLSHDGRHVRHDIAGYYLCTTEEGDYEDEGHASAGFDGRAHFLSVKDALEAANNGEAS